jgi:CRP-like cAMP-binding protein
MSTTMSNFSQTNHPSFSTSVVPSYQPLSGPSLQQALSLLQRKGGLLDPVLTRDEALKISSFLQLEHFELDAVISFDSQNKKQGRLMLILAGEVNIRLRDTSHSRTQYSPVDQHERWSTATEGATLGLVHAFSGLSSRFLAQATTELFVASITRETFNTMKQQQPILALRFLEMVTMELALVTLDHERSLQAMNNVARSMQNMIDGESGATRPAGLF